MGKSTNTIVSVYGLQDSKRFRNKVSHLINDHLGNYGHAPVREIYVSDAGMYLAHGYGQYKKYVDIKIDGTLFHLKEHSTDSQDFDFFYHKNEVNRTWSNRIKGLILMVIENKLEYIESEIVERRGDQISNEESS